MVSSIHASKRVVQGLQRGGEVLDENTSSVTTPWKPSKSDSTTGSSRPAGTAAGGMVALRDAVQMDDASPMQPALHVSQGIGIRATRNAPRR
jgi:hypothetical protein